MAGQRRDKSQDPGSYWTDTFEVNIPNEATFPLIIYIVTDINGEPARIAFKVVKVQQPTP
jgi:hypothetical protein